MFLLIFEHKISFHWKLLKNTKGNHNVRKTFKRLKMGPLFKKAAQGPILRKQPRAPIRLKRALVTLSVTFLI
jgi:hypothetical protein